MNEVSTQEQRTSPERIDPRHIALAMTTHYPTWFAGESAVERRSPDKIRGDLALQSIQKAIDLGYQLAVVDGGSSETFVNELDQLGITVHQQKERGMSGARRQSYRTASRLAGVAVIVSTEAEKLSMVHDDVLSRLALPIVNGEADIVIAGRSDHAYRSYPKKQAKSEIRGNMWFNDLLRSHRLLSQNTMDFDIFFGPKALKNTREVLDLFLSSYEFRTRGDLALDKIIDPERWPDALFLPVIAALHEGYIVKNVPVSYTHPLEQTMSEQDSPEYMRIRDVQLRSIITTAIHYMRLLDKDNRSRLVKVSPETPASL